MASPTYVSSNAYSGTNAPSNRAISFSTPSDGDIIIVACDNDGTTALTISSAGWTNSWTQIENPGYYTTGTPSRLFSVWWIKWQTGDPTTVTLGGGDGSSAAAYYIVNGADGTTPIADSASTGDSTDPPAVSYDSNDVLVVAVAAGDGKNNSYTAPTNYTNQSQSTTNNDGPDANASIAISSRALTSSTSENPGTYSGAVHGVVATIAVYAPYTPPVTGSFTANAVIKATRSRSYTDLVRSMAPDGYWPLADTSGNFADESGNGYTATVSGTPVYEATGPTIDSEAQKAVTFDGSTDYANASEAVDDGATSFSLSWWMRSDLTSGTGYIASQRDDSTNPHSWSVYFDAVDTPAQLQLYIRNAADTGYHAYTDSAPNGDTMDGNWHHVVATFDGTNAHLYVDDGIDAGEGGGDHTGWEGPTAIPFTIAAGSSTGGSAFTGDLAHMAYWKSVLTSEQRSLLASGPVGGFTADAIIVRTEYDKAVLAKGPKGYFPLRDLSGEELITETTMSFSNSPTTSSDAPGYMEGSVAFDGIDQSGSADHADFRPTTGLTLCGWVKLSSEADSGLLFIMGAGDNGFDGYHIRTPGDNAGSTKYTSLVGQVKNGTDTLTNGFGYRQLGLHRWRFFAITYDKSNLRMYHSTGAGIVEDGGSPDAGTHDLGYGGEPFKIGTIDTGLSYWPGEAAGVAIYDYALTEAELLVLRKAGHPFDFTADAQIVDDADYYDFFDRRYDSSNSPGTATDGNSWTVLGNPSNCTTTVAPDTLIDTYSTNGYSILHRRLDHATGLEQQARALFWANEAIESDVRYCVAGRIRGTTGSDDYAIYGQARVNSDGTVDSRIFTYENGSGPNTKADFGATGLTGVSYDDKINVETLVTGTSVTGIDVELRIWLEGTARPSTATRTWNTTDTAWDTAGVTGTCTQSTDVGGVTLYTTRFLSYVNPPRGGFTADAQIIRADVGYDFFDRTGALDTSTSSSGDTWDGPAGGGATVWSTDGEQAYVALDPADYPGTDTLYAHTATLDMRVLTRYRFASDPTAGENKLIPYVTGRVHATNGYWIGMGCYFSGDGGIHPFLRVNDSGGLGSPYNIQYDEAAWTDLTTEEFYLELIIYGTSPIYVEGRVWKVGDARPTSPNVSDNFTNSDFNAAAQSGMWVYNNDSVSNTAYVKYIETYSYTPPSSFTADAVIKALTPVHFVCGAECQSDSTQTGNDSTYEHLAYVLGGGTASIVSTPLPVGAAKAWDLTATGTSGKRIGIFSVDGSSDQYYIRFKMACSAWSDMDATTNIMIAGNDVDGVYYTIHYDATADEIQASVPGQASSTLDFTPVDDTWYVFEVEVDSANGDMKWRYKEDGGSWSSTETVDGSGASLTAGTNNAYLALGYTGGSLSFTGTVHLYATDVVAVEGGTIWDEASPRDGNVRRLSANADGTHSSFDTGDFTKSGTNASNTDTDLNTHLDAADMEQSSEYIDAVNAASGDYFEIHFEDTPTGYTDPQAVGLTASLDLETAGDLTLRVSDDGTNWTDTDRDFSNTAGVQFITSGLVGTDGKAPSGSDLTTSLVDSMRTRVLANTTGDFRVYGLALEVEYGTYTPGGSGSFTADAVIEKTQTGSFTANAVIKRTQTFASYTELVKTLSPDAYWPLDDASGNFRDASGNGYPGTASGTPLYEQTGPTINSEAQSAVTFDGSTEYATVAEGVDDSATTSTGMTFSAWFKTAATTYKYIARGGEGPSDRSWLVGINEAADNGLVQIFTWQTDGATLHGGGESISTIDANDDAWHHVVAWVDATDNYLHISVDGETTQTDDTVTGTWNAATPAPVYFAGTSNNWDGELAHVAYWASVLSAADRALLASGQMGFTANAVIKKTQSGSFTANAVIWGTDADYWDNFAWRSVSGTLGTSSDGNDWSNDAGWNVGSGVAYRTFNDANGAIVSFDHADVVNTRVRILLSFDTDPVAGADGHWFHIHARDHTSPDDLYSASFRFLPNGDITARVDIRNAGVWDWDQFSTNTTPVDTWTDLTTEKWWLEYEVTGEQDHELRVWKDGTARPSTPSLSGTSSGTAITTGGTTGWRMGSDETFDTVFSVWQHEVWDLGPLGGSFTADAVIEKAQSGSFTADAQIVRSDYYDFFDRSVSDGTLGNTTDGYGWTDDDDSTTSHMSWVVANDRVEASFTANGLSPFIAYPNWPVLTDSTSRVLYGVSTIANDAWYFYAAARYNPANVFRFETLAVLGTDGAVDLLIRKYTTAGGFVTLDNVTDALTGITASDKLWVECFISGQSPNIRGEGRVWKDGTARPSSPNVSFSDLDDTDMDAAGRTHLLFGHDYNGTESGYVYSIELWMEPVVANFTADAVIQKAQSGSFTADAVKAISVTASVTTDAVIERTQSGSFTADAIIEASQAGSFTTDSIVLAAGSASFTADAVVLAALVGGLFADAVVLETRSGSLSADAWVQPFFTVDAYVSGTTTGTFTADAVLLAPRSGAVSADAVVAVTQTGALTLDAILLRQQPGAVSLDAVLLAPVVGVFQVDATFAATTTGQFSADAVVKQTQSGQFVTDAIVQRTAEDVFSADAVLLAGQSQSYVIDAIRYEQFTHTDLVLDAVIVGTQASSFAADAFFIVWGPWSEVWENSVGTYTGSFTADAWIFVSATTETGSFTADAVRSDSATSQTYLDATILKVVDGQVTTEATLLAQIEGQFLVSAAILAQNVGGVTLDAALQKQQTAQLTVDAVVIAGISDSLSVDAVLLRVGSESASLDAVFFSAQSGALTADAWLELSVASTFTADAVIFRTRTGSFTANAFIAGVGVAAFSADAVIERTSEASTQTDAAILATGVGAFVIDAVQERAISAGYSLDAVISAEQVGSLTADAIFDRLWEQSTTADAVIEARIVGSFAVDAVTEKGQTGQVFADAVLQRTQEGSFATDAVIVLGTQTASFSVDAAVQRTYTGALNVDAYVSGLGVAAFSADAIVHQQAEASLLVDATVQALVEGQFQSDAIVFVAQQAGFSAEAVIRSTQDQFLTCDAILAETYGGVFVVDAILQAEQQDTFQTDAVVTAAVGGSLDVDAVVLRAHEASFASDALLAETIIASFGASAYIEGAGVGAISLDAVVERTTTAALVAAAFLVETVTGSFTSDAWLEETTAGSVTTDAVITGTASGTLSSDAVLSGTSSATFSADSIINRTAVQSLTIDAWISGAQTAGFVADAVLLAAQAGAFTADAALWPAYWTVALDASISRRITQSIEATFDAATISATNDAAVIEASFSVGTISWTRIEMTTQTGSYSLDAVLT